MNVALRPWRQPSRMTRLTTRWCTPRRDYAPTYWVATARTPPEDDGPVGADLDATWSWSDPASPG